MTPGDRLLLPPRADLYQALIDRAYALGVRIGFTLHAEAAHPYYLQRQNLRLVFDCFDRVILLEFIG